MNEKTASEIWFETYCVDNPIELLEIGELAMKVLDETISLGTHNAETTIACYARIFSSILAEVAEEKKTKSEFIAKIANRLEIGYDINCDENNEANAFTPIMRHIENKSEDAAINDDTDETIVLCTNWNTANVKENIEFINRCAIRAKRDLQDVIKIKTESHEYVIPLFSIIHSQIINYVRLKRVELDLFRYEINVAGLFNVGSEIDDNQEEHIYYIPEPALKLDTKADAIVNNEE